VIKKITDLTPQRVNSNKHTPRGLGLLQDSIQKDGWLGAITVANDGESFDGSARIEVGASAGFEDAIVVESDGSRPIIHRRTDIPTADDPKARRLGVAANRIAQLDYDPDAAVLAGIVADGIDLSDLFTGEEFEALIADVEGDDGGINGDPDEIPENVETRCKSGDLWRLGRHRLLCGDSTKAGDVARVMGGEKADMVFTDPPYNYGSENAIIAADCSKSMQGLKDAEWDKDFDLRPALDCIFSVLADDVTVYVCSSHHLSPVVWSWMGEWATHHSWCVWSKPNPMPSLMKRHWTWNAELIPYGTRGKHTFNFPDDGHALCVWTIAKSKETNHPTEKVVGVPVHAITHSSKPADIIYDPFLGSGTTLIAAEQTGRKCYGIEISEKYCDVIIQRWENATGQQAELIENGNQNTT